MNLEKLLLPPLGPEEERRAAGKGLQGGFHYRPPPPPEGLATFITPDEKLFETIHMGAVDVDPLAWRLQVDGLVNRPFSIDMDGLRLLPQHTVKAFHECFGSPLKAATENVGRIGNVEWTGVRLSLILALAQLKEEAAFVWTDGLDSGNFGGKMLDRYRKDLPLSKALSDEVLLAYELNGHPLRKERGGPVRLVVPGWFGTNMTKWLCRISAQACRSTSPFTTDWYNERVVIDGVEARRPVWDVAPNSLIVEPLVDQQLQGAKVSVRGWAWGGKEIVAVQVSGDGGDTWHLASVTPRAEFEWQRFKIELPVNNRQPQLMSRARDVGGNVQPLVNARNAVVSVRVTII